MRLYDHGLEGGRMGHRHSTTLQIPLRPLSNHPLPRHLVQDLVQDLPQPTPKVSRQRGNVLPWTPRGLRAFRQTTPWYLLP